MTENTLVHNLLFERNVFLNVPWFAVIYIHIVLKYLLKLISMDLRNWIYHGVYVTVLVKCASFLKQSAFIETVILMFLCLRWIKKFSPCDNFVYCYNEWQAMPSATVCCDVHLTYWLPSACLYFWNIHILNLNAAVDVAVAHGFIILYLWFYCQFVQCRY